MFAPTQSDQYAAAELANQHLKSWEKTLALRISLQKSIDIGNQLPAESISELFSSKKDTELIEESKLLSKGLQTVLKELVDATNSQASNISGYGNFDNKLSNKRKRDDEITWEEVEAPQNHMNAYWETVVNKWHARLNFGSEHVKSKMKVFNQTIWNQIDETLSNESRVIEKSRLPLNESTRVHLTTSADSGTSSSKKTKHSPSPSDESDAEDSADDSEAEANKKFDRKVNKQYDLEVYDDRSFYSMLLKTFITSASSSSNTNMRADDLEALRKYKRKKSNVERKASKGRKIRYTVHAKLTNFMFPVPLIAPNQLDVERLHASLFQ